LTSFGPRNRQEMGLQPERTALAWARTSFAVLTNGALLMVRNLHGEFGFRGDYGSFRLFAVGVAIVLRAMHLSDRCPTPTDTCPPPTSTTNDASPRGPSGRNLGARAHRSLSARIGRLTPAPRGGCARPACNPLDDKGFLSAHQVDRESIRCRHLRTGSNRPAEARR